MNAKYSIEDILTLVEQNFEFLHTGKFLAGYYIKKHNLELEAKNIKLVLGHKSYLLRGDIIKQSLGKSFINSDRNNILDYFVEWNAFRGIAMAMKDGISNNHNFKEFLEERLGDKFKHFEYIIAFIRNVLSHNVDNEIRLIKDNFEKTANSFKKNVCKSGIARLEFRYNEDFPDKTGFPEDYCFTIEIRFCDLKEGKRFIDIVSEWHLLMIMELCFNLVTLYRKSQN